MWKAVLYLNICFTRACGRLFVSSGFFCPLITLTFSFNVPFVMYLCLLKSKHDVQRWTEFRDPVCGRDDVRLLRPDHRKTDWGTARCNPHRGKDISFSYAMYYDQLVAGVNKTKCGKYNSVVFVLWGSGISSG